MVDKKLVGIGVGLGIAAVLLIVLNLGLLVLAIFMLIWNISDIQNVGPNFWNVAWIVLAALMLLSTLRGVFSRN